MPVGTWGYGTGATTSAAHPFSLTIQGVDVVEAVHIDTISVSQSVSSNATMTFTITDVAGTMAIPEGWADVVFSEHTGSAAATGTFQDELTQDDSFDEGEAVELAPPEVIFGGLVMGVNVRLGAPPIRYFDVRCVDYGVLLDVTPLTAELSGATHYMESLIQAVAALAPLGGLTAIPASGDQPGLGVFGGPYVEDEVTVTPAWTVARSAIDAFLEEGTYVWVSPLRNISTTSAAVAPLEVRVNPTTSGHVAAEAFVDWDHRVAESGVYVQDSVPDVGGDASGFVGGTFNGYTVAPGQFSAFMPGIPVIPPPPPPGEPAEPTYDTERARAAASYLASHGSNAVARLVVESSSNFMAGQLLTVYYPTLGLDGVYAIHAVTTRFLGGTDNLRRSEIQFGGELGTVSRFNRTRFARAGVTT